jgi:choline dehydrogenase-like flavoprotein
MTLARELSRVAEVLVIESGGFDHDSDHHELLVGESVGADYPLTETRIRQFGGSSNLWAGYCARFDDHDFVHRPWVPRSGWPLGIEQLEKYYGAAADVLNLGVPEFNAHNAARESGFTLPFDAETFVPTVWRFGAPTVRFAESMRREFETSSNIVALLHANVVDIRVDRDRGKVEELVVRTLCGRQGSIPADIVVLACGGLETPRLLLNADSQLRDGVGNSSGTVGRFFMEHPHRAIGSLALHRNSVVEHWTRRQTSGDNREFMFALGLTAEVQAEEKLLNARAHVYRTPHMRPGDAPRVGLFMEQQPSADSRVVLSHRTDALGMRRIRLDWRLTDLDRRTHEITGGLLAREFERIGAGRVEGLGLQAAMDDAILHSNHHLGTTRMSATSAEGVVDPNCRMHDLSNAYIIGGSIFPTVSWANPTFTLMALTFRLADHLRAKL